MLAPRLPVKTTRKSGGGAGATPKKPGTKNTASGPADGGGDGPDGSGRKPKQRRNKRSRLELEAAAAPDDVAETFGRLGTDDTVAGEHPDSLVNLVSRPALRCPALCLYKSSACAAGAASQLTGRLDRSSFGFSSSFFSLNTLALRGPAWPLLWLAGAGACKHNRTSFTLLSVLSSTCAANQE